MYDFTEAARLTGLNPTRVRRWFSHRPSEPNRAQILTPDYAPRDGVHTISFLDLVDVFVFGQLRTHGVSLPTLRRVYARLRDDLGRNHPFAHSRLATDGRDVFLRVADASGRDELVEVLTRQMVMVQVIDPFLKRLEYDPATHLARRWRIADGVVIDPAFAFGKPVVTNAGIKTEVLAAAYAANGKDADRVAWWYDVSPADVLAAVRFESGLSA